MSRVWHVINSNQQNTQDRKVEMLVMAVQACLDNSQHLAKKMKAITCPVILDRVSTRSDGSLTLSFSTPELTPDEKLVFLELQKKNLKMLLQPTDEITTEMKEVRGQFETRTPSQRLRSCLYIYWKQASGQGEFDDFYRKQMDEIINNIKTKLAK